jgi:diguanylate cyclase
VDDRVTETVAPPPRGSPNAGSGLRLGVLLVAVVVAAAGIVAAGAVPVWPALAATLLTTFALGTNIWVRAGRRTVRLGWGEAAAVVACYLLPATVVPAVFLVAVSIAQLFRLRTVRDRSVSLALSNAAALSLVSAGAAATAWLIGLRPYNPLRPATVLALATAGAVYYLLSLLLVSALAATESHHSYRSVVRILAVSKAPMAVGNLMIGIGALTAMMVNPWWLFALPPALWLIHQTYTHRLRAEEERRAWQVFSETTRELNHLDERRAAAAGLRGIWRLFDPVTAEIVIDGPPGRPRAYQMAQDGAVTRTEPPNLKPTVPVAVRQLLVGGARVGELRLHRTTPINRRDGLMLAAYGDALAASVHDAATNTELQTLTERSTFDAMHDGLTGLPNRASLLVRGAAMLHTLASTAPAALLLLDVNHFKEVNTTLGHAAGDELLQIVASRLSAETPPGGYLARLGGDEFALLVTGRLAAAEATVAWARSLADHLAVPTEVSGVQLSVEASIGVVASTAGGADMTELLRRADIAMYQAKGQGSSVSRYDPERDRASTDRLALLAELREALASDDQVDVVVQPVVALDSGQPIAVEAFVRWQHPRRGTLTPIHFVRAVEQSELLGPFTRYVLDRALAVAAELADRGVAVPISINLSPRSLHDRQLPAVVAQTLQRYRIAPEGLILEITETVVLREDRVVDEVLAQLRTLGVRLAVDDFGTGYSALTFLTRVPINEVKIDRSFVTRMVDSAEAAAIVRITVELGRELGLRVVAEGVETPEQRRALAALGCPAAQGFHFYPPMAVGSLIEALREAAAAPAGGPVRHLRAAE